VDEALEAIAAEQLAPVALAPVAIAPVTAALFSPVNLSAFAPLRRFALRW